MVLPRPAGRFAPLADAADLDDAAPDAADDRELEGTTVPAAAKKRGRRAGRAPAAQPGPGTAAPRAGRKRKERASSPPPEVPLCTAPEQQHAAANLPAPTVTVPQATGASTLKTPALRSVLAHHHVRAAAGESLTRRGRACASPRPSVRNTASSVVFDGMSSVRVEVKRFVETTVDIAELILSSTIAADSGPPGLLAQMDLSASGILDLLRHVSYTIRYVQASRGRGARATGEARDRTDGPKGGAGGCAADAARPVNLRDSAQSFREASPKQPCGNVGSGPSVRGLARN